MNETPRPEDHPDGWPIYELWDKYEAIAMHFNDLLIRLRTSALGGVAALSTLVGIFSRTGADVRTTWEIAGGVFLFLWLFWIAIWVIDFCYYNRLLLGAVAAITRLETESDSKSRIHYIEISKTIERAVEGEFSSFDKLNLKRNLGRWLFYSIVFLALSIGLAFT